MTVVLYACVRQESRAVFEDGGEERDASGVRGKEGRREGARVLKGA